MRAAISILLGAATAACGGPAAAPDNRPEAAAPTESEPATDAKPAPAPEPAATVLAAGGLGTIHIGKPPADAAGFALRDDGSYQDSCRIFVTDQQPGLYVLVEDGIVRRVTIHRENTRGAALTTAKRIRVGSTEAEVRAAYAPLGSEPHKYSEPPAKYLNYGEEGDPNGLRFEIGAGGRVTAIHAGASPQLTYVEGCS